MRKKSVLTVVLVMMLSVVWLLGCSQRLEGEPGADLAEKESETGGVLCLSVNPEIAVFYDADGKVIRVEGRNEDGNAILQDVSGYEGKDVSQVVKELVTAIGEAGYFVEEVEGKSRQITIEIEKGSILPSDTFLDEVISGVHASIDHNGWNGYVDLRGESDYGMTDYADTDYGPHADQVTGAQNTDRVPNPVEMTDYGITDYDDTDYGPHSDGVTDKKN